MSGREKKHKDEGEGEGDGEVRCRGWRTFPPLAFPPVPSPN